MQIKSCRITLDRREQLEKYLRDSADRRERFHRLADEIVYKRERPTVEEMERYFAAGRELLPDLKLDSVYDAEKARNTMRYRASVEDARRLVRGR